MYTAYIKKAACKPEQSEENMECYLRVYCYKAVQTENNDRLFSVIGYNMKIFSGYPILTLGNCSSFAYPFQRQKQETIQVQLVQKKGKLSFVCMATTGAVCSGSLQGQPLSVLDFHSLYGNIHCSSILRSILKRETAQMSLSSRMDK